MQSQGPLPSTVTLSRNCPLPPWRLSRSCGAAEACPCLPLARFHLTLRPATWKGAEGGGGEAGGGVQVGAVAGDLPQTSNSRVLKGKYPFMQCMMHACVCPTVDLIAPEQMWTVVLSAFCAWLVSL